MSRLDAAGDGRGALGADLEGRRANDRAVPRPPVRKTLLGPGRRPDGSAERRVPRLAGPRRAASPRARSPAGGQPEAKQARLAYRHLSQLRRCVAGRGRRSDTGRKHQIRVQLAQHGHPVARRSEIRQSAARLPRASPCTPGDWSFTHPVRDEQLGFEAPLPRSWADFGFPDYSSLGSKPCHGVSAGRNRRGLPNFSTAAQPWHAMNPR